MPLWETIVIGRCSDARGAANLLRTLAISVINRGGNVRELKILGDRILTKYIKGNDGKRHIIGRYYQILYDSNFDVRRECEKSAKDSFEALRIHTHLLKDFFNEAQLHKKSLSEQSPISSEMFRKREYLSQLSQFVKDNGKKSIIIRS